MKNPEITSDEFFERLNTVPNYTAKNLKVKIKGGTISIGEISIRTTKIGKPEKKIKNVKGARKK